MLKKLLIIGISSFLISCVLTPTTIKIYNYGDFVSFNDHFYGNCKGEVKDYSPASTGWKYKIYVECSTTWHGLIWVEENSLIKITN